jgi:hypothetical protein
MSRNVWLSFSEWELINSDLSDQDWHSFQLSQRQVNEWKKDISRYSYYENRKFERVGVYPEIEKVKSARALNVLCRENWRSQDMYDMMKCPHSFIGFIITHIDDVDMNTTFNQWESIRHQMNDVIQESNQRIWFVDNLIELYKKVTSPSLVHNV